MTDYRMMGVVMAQKRGIKRAALLAMALNRVDAPDERAPINRLLTHDGGQYRKGTGTRPVIGVIRTRDTLGIERANVDGNRKPIPSAQRIGAYVDPLTGLTHHIDNPNEED